MAKKVYEEKNIRAIAERIRRKTGFDKLYKVSDMPAGIDEVFAAGGSGVAYAQFNDIISAQNERIYTPSEGLLYSYDGVYNVIGRGSCTDRVIVIPETYDDGVHGEHPVRHIGGGAFKNDQTIEEIILPETEFDIGNYPYPFEGSSLKIIKNFYECVVSFALSGFDLEYVSFLDGANIDNYDFSGIVGSPVYDFGRHTSVAELSDASYISVVENTKILVPAALLDEWKQATNWTVYAQYIVAADKVAEIKSNITKVYDAGYGEAEEITSNIIDGSITEFVIPEGTTNIKDYAFSYCRNLIRVTIPDSVMSIGDNAFYFCQALTSIEIPDSVTSIGRYAFQGCTNLASVIIGDGVTSIDTNTFYNCSSLTRATFGNGLTSIGTHAFYGCPKLKLYDFSRCAQIPTLPSSSSLSVKSDTKIIVPSFLYDKWTSATNWTLYKDYIVPKDVKAPPMEDNFDVFIGAEELQETIKEAVSVGVGNNEILYDNGIPYLRIYGDGSSPEAYSYITDIEGKVTGKYLVFAYRLPVGNIEVPSYIDIYTNTSGLEITGNGDRLSFLPTIDEKWQVAVIDIEEAISNSTEVVNGTATSKFIANSDGTYGIKNFRLDWFNQITSTDSYIDIAYVGICGSLEKARQADANYTGKCYEPDDFVSKLGSSKAVKGSYNGMPYVTITDTTQASGEQFVELHRSNHILPDTSRYIGILYRNAPGQHAEAYISSDNVNWIANCQINYDVSDGWHFGVMAIGSDVYRDSVCRRLRFDYFNNLSASTEYSIDIGFVKFFGTEEEANEYYKTYKVKYDLN